MASWSCLLHANVVVNLFNNTKYTLKGVVRWGSSCSSDTFFLKPAGSGESGHWLVGSPDSQATISWNNFLGLGKTCPLQAISFKATTPNAYNKYINDELSFEYIPKQKISVGPRGVCENMRIFVNESNSDEKFAIEYECFD